MSVIIHGMNMPKRCADCPMCNDDNMGNFWCSALDSAPDMSWEEMLNYNRKEFCPLRETFAPDKRKQILDYLCEFNVRADIKIEELADDIISIIEA